MRYTVALVFKRERRKAIISAPCIICGVIIEQKFRPRRRAISGRMAIRPKGQMRKDSALPMTCSSQYPLGEAAIPKSIDVL